MRGTRKASAEGRGDPSKPLAAASERLLGKCKQRCERVKGSTVTDTNSRPEDAQDTGQMQLFTVSQVANILQISVRKTWDLVGRGKLVAVKIDRSTRVAFLDLDNYISSLRRGSP